ncbi:ankyrin repeat domain-containing protein 53 [Lissotriton helveticus]
MTSPAPQASAGGTSSKKHLERDQLLAAAVGNLPGLQLSLKITDDQIKADKYGFTAVHLAALHGRLQCLQLLVRYYKADVNQRSKAGWRPIHLALSKKGGPRAVECVKYLIEQGADVNLKTDSKVTPLHQAANEGLLDCIVVLTEAGADTHAIDAYGRRPIDLSKMWNHRPCVRYLRHAMWMRDKDELAEEMHKMEQLKINLGNDKFVSKKYKKEQDLFCQMAFCDWLENKRFEEKCKKASLEAGLSPDTDAHDPRRTKKRRGIIEKLLHKAEEYQREVVVLPSPEPQKEETASTSKSPTKGKSPPHPVVPDKKAAEKKTPEKKTPEKKTPVKEDLKEKMFFEATPRTGSGLKKEITLEDLKDFDFGSYLSYTKDMFDKPNIQLLRGGSIAPPTKLTKDEMRRTIVPTAALHRIKMPEEFKAKHIFDVKRKRMPAHGFRQESEVGMHLRETLDPSGLGAGEPRPSSTASYCSS